MEGVEGVFEGMGGGGQEGGESGRERRAASSEQRPPTHLRMRACPFFCCPLACRLAHSTSRSIVLRSELCCFSSTDSRLFFAPSHSE